jgi:predicted transcriptional regulator
MNLRGFVPNGIYTLIITEVTHGESMQKKTPFTELTFDIGAPATAKYNGQELPVAGLQVKKQIYWTEKSFERAAGECALFGIPDALSKSVDELKLLLEKSRGAVISAAVTSKSNVLRESLTPEDLKAGKKETDKPAIIDEETKEPIVLSYTKEIRQIIEGSVRFPNNEFPY